VDESIARAWAAEDRLTPWLVYDLERIAWVIGARAGELSEDEARIVRSASEQMLAAIESNRVAGTGDDASA
jgi:hypothetical protein